MTFIEKLQLVVISVLLGILANIIILIIKDKRIKKNVLIRANNNIGLFARNLETSIINDDKELPKNNYLNLLCDYSVISNNKKLKEKFEFVSGIYTFLTNGGYDTLKNRRETDLNEIKKFMKKWNY